MFRWNICYTLWEEIYRVGKGAGFMRKQVMCTLNMALLSFVLLIGCGKTEVSQQEIVENIQETENDADGSVKEPTETDVQEAISWRKAPILSSTEWVDNRFADDGTLLVEGRFQTVEVSGEGYEKAADAIRIWNTKQEAAFVENVDLNEEYALDEVGISTNFYGYSSTVEVSAVRVDASIISLEGFYYDYSGGVHGNSAFHGATFDSQTGQQLSFWDLAEDKEAFSKVTLETALEQVTEEYADGLFEGYEAIIREIWETEPNWYLDGAGLTIIFSPYEIGPYAMGPVYVRITYQELGTLLKSQYQMGAQAGVAVLPLGEVAEISLNHETGEKGMVQLVRSEEDYGGIYQYILKVGEQTKVAAEIDRLEHIYLIQKENGRTFLLFDGDMASDDYVTYMYELTDGQIQKTYESDGCAFICEGTVTTEGVQLGMRVDALGTYTAYGNFEITEAGALEPVSEWYDINSSYEWQGLTNIKDLPVVVDGQEKVLPAGSQFRIIGTNRNGILKYQLVESLEEGEIYYTTGEDNWPIYIDGINENEYFEMLPYAG